MKKKKKPIRFKAKKKKRYKGKREPLNLLGPLKVVAVVCVLAAIVVGVVFLEKYVEKTVGVSEREGFLELINTPSWVNEALERKVYEAARLYGEDMKLDADSAAAVQGNLETIAWLEDVKVRTMHERFQVEARWRKPLAMVKSGMNIYYIDKELVVLDFVPMPELAIVKIAGLSNRQNPEPGSVLDEADLAAALELLAKLNKMDEAVTADKPLLYEIDRIDVSNFNGRQNHKASHIIMYTTDNTEILWGAEVGTWQRYLEAPDEEKLTNLYEYYKEYGSLLNSAKYINLRYSQNRVALPADKY